MPVAPGDTTDEIRDTSDGTVNDIRFHMSNCRPGESYIYNGEYQLLKRESLRQKSYSSIWRWSLERGHLPEQVRRPAASILFQNRIAKQQRYRYRYS